MVCQRSGEETLVPPNLRITQGFTVGAYLPLSRLDRLGQRRQHLVQVADDAIVRDIEDRRSWERPLLARYLRRLTECGLVEVPSFEEAWHDYGCELNYGLFIFMINESHFQHEEVNTAYTARFGAAVIDHDVLRI